MDRNGYITLNFFVLIFGVFLPDFIFFYQGGTYSPKFHQNCAVVRSLVTRHKTRTLTAVSRQWPQPRKQFHGTRVGICDAV